MTEKQDRERQVGEYFDSLDDSEFSIYQILLDNTLSFYHGIINAPYMLRAYLMQRYFDTFHIPHKNSCTRGCAFCCYQTVTVSVSEAKMLRDQLTPEQKEYVLNQADDLLQEPIKNRRCVFLKGVECTVYDKRPMTCRGYTVVTPPQDCNLENGIVKVASFANYKQEIARAGLLMRDGSGHLHTLLKQLLTHKPTNNVRNSSQRV